MANPSTCRSDQKLLLQTYNISCPPDCKPGGKNAKKYREISRQIHPDKFGDKGEEVVKRQTALFQDFTNAYENVIDNQCVSSLDPARPGRPARPAQPPSPPPPAICSIDSACDMAQCIQSINGMSSDSTSPTDTWAITFSNPTSMKSVSDNYIPVTRAFLKLFISPDSWADKLANNPANIEKYITLCGLSYEISVYTEVINPLLDFEISPHFIRIYASAKNCTWDNLHQMLKKESTTKNNTTMRLNRNLSYMNEWKERRPSIQDNSDPSIYDPGFKDKKYSFIVNEMITSGTKSLEDVLKDEISERDLYNILFQIAQACYAMYLSKTAHNDLHSKNIWIIPQASKNIKYIINDNEFILTDVKHNVKIYDFDRAYAVKLHANPIITRAKCAQHGECNEIVEGKDFAKLLCFVSRNLRAYNSSHGGGNINPDNLLQLFTSNTFFWKNTFATTCWMSDYSHLLSYPSILKNIYQKIRSNRVFNNLPPIAKCNIGMFDSEGRVKSPNISAYKLEIMGAITALTGRYQSFLANAATVNDILKESNDLVAIAATITQSLQISSNQVRELVAKFPIAEENVKFQLEKLLNIRLQVKKLIEEYTQSNIAGSTGDVLNGWGSGVSEIINTVRNERTQLSNTDDEITNLLAEFDAAVLELQKAADKHIEFNKAITTISNQLPAFQADITTLSGTITRVYQNYITETNKFRLPLDPVLREALNNANNILENTNNRYQTARQAISDFRAIAQIVPLNKSNPREFVAKQKKTTVPVVSNISKKIEEITSELNGLLSQYQAVLQEKEVRRAAQLENERLRIERERLNTERIRVEAEQNAQRVQDAIIQRRVHEAAELLEQQRNEKIIADNANSDMQIDHNENKRSEQEIRDFMMANALNDPINEQKETDAIWEKSRFLYGKINLIMTDIKRRIEGFNHVSDEEDFYTIPLPDLNTALSEFQTIRNHIEIARNQRGSLNQLIEWYTILLKEYTELMKKYDYMFIRRN